jgi:hypothetical protein
LIFKIKRRNMNPTTPDPAGLTIDQRAQAIYQELLGEAQRHNTDVVAAYDSAVMYANQSTGRGFPTALPVPPMLWRPNYPAVLAAESNTDPTKVSTLWSFDLIFTTFQYVPVAPAPTAPTPLTVAETLPGMPGIVEMSGDSTTYPVGVQVNVGGHEYQKIQIGSSPMGPEYAWQQVS